MNAIHPECGSVPAPDQLESSMTERLEFLAGDIAVDDRGRLSFCNDFDMARVRRFYVVSNHQPGFVRAWHAHRQETKYAYVVSGAALFAAVEIDDWENPDPALPVTRMTLSEDKPGVLCIPGGHAHGFMTLTPETKVMFFSTTALDESLGDDIRYPHDYWKPWHIEPR